MGAGTGLGFSWYAPKGESPAQAGRGELPSCAVRKAFPWSPGSLRRPGSSRHFLLLVERGDFGGEQGGPHQYRHVRLVGCEVLPGTFRPLWVNTFRVAPQSMFGQMGASMFLALLHLGCFGGPAEGQWLRALSSKNLSLEYSGCLYLFALYLFLSLSLCGSPTLSMEVQSRHFSGGRYA